MYSVNIYEDFENGEFKLLETYYAYAIDRADAKLKALRYAEEKYKNRKIKFLRKLIIHFNNLIFTAGCNYLNTFAVKIPV